MQKKAPEPSRAPGASVVEKLSLKVKERERERASFAPFDSLTYLILHVGMLLVNGLLNYYTIVKMKKEFYSSMV